MVLYKPSSLLKKEHLPQIEDIHQTHWNVSKERLESIAEHVYGTCILALSIDSEFETNLDINKVVKMLVIHELGEVVIGECCFQKSESSTNGKRWS